MLCFFQLRRTVSPSPLRLLSNNTSERWGHPDPDPLSEFHILYLQPISKYLKLTKPNPNGSIFHSVTVFFPEFPALFKGIPLLLFTLSSFPHASDTLPAIASNPRHVRMCSSRLYSCPSGMSYRPGCLQWGWIQNPGSDGTGHTSLF